MTSADFNMGRVRGLPGRVSGMHWKHRLGVLERQCGRISMALLKVFQQRQTHAWVTLSRR